MDRGKKWRVRKEGGGEKTEQQEAEEEPCLALGQVLSPEATGIHTRCPQAKCLPLSHYSLPLWLANRNQSS